MSDKTPILWLTTPTTTTRLRVGDELTPEDLRNYDLILWNRAGILRYFPHGIVLNLRQQYRMLLDRPNKQTSLSSDALSLTWSQALVIDDRVQVQLKRMVAL